MSNETYNGWANYETWCVNLWITNDQSSMNYWELVAEGCLENADELHEVFTREESARADFCHRLKEHFEDHPLADNADVFTDLLNSAIAMVDWMEIAKAFIHDAVAADAN